MKSIERRRLVSIVLALLVLAGIASVAQVVIPDGEAAKHIGEVVSVRGRVAGVYTSRSNTTFINFGKPYPHHTFTAVIFSSASTRFKNAASWEGRVITVTGHVKLYRGKPEIVLNGMDQVAE
jgi:DNA/RNA endonuclease YhcR with UshA esterase domain